MSTQFPFAAEPGNDTGNGKGNGKVNGKGKEKQKKRSTEYVTCELNFFLLPPPKPFALAVCTWRASKFTCKR
jgi:hypothetical protein